MRGFLKWFLAPAVLVAGLMLLSPQTAEARRWCVRAYYPGYHATYVYRYPRRAYYYAPAPYFYAPAPVSVYRPPAYFYPPAMPAPVPYVGYYVW